MAEHIVGKNVFIDKQPIMLYSKFCNMQGIVDALPEDKKENIQITEDSLSVKVYGMEIGVKLTERVPFSKLGFVQYGNTPFPFNLTLHFDPALTKDGATDFHIELSAELNTMMKMMIGGKLQAAVDQITDAISQAASGQMPSGFDSYVM
jgi:hypothetical protein